MAPSDIISGREGEGAIGEESPLMGDDSSSLSLEMFVAPILLSLAKDARYVSQLSTLLSDVVRPYLPSSTSTSASNNPEERLDPEWTLLASILYVLFMFREGRSLGMEFTSLEFTSTTTTTTHNNNTNSGDSRGQGLWRALSPNNSKNSSKKLSTALTLLRAVAFGMLYTIPPYFFRRAARGGWDEVRNLWTAIMYQNGGGTIRRRNQHMNDERLRGIDRRRVFLEQRRLMTERSLHPQQHSTQSNSTTTTTTTTTTTDTASTNITEIDPHQLGRTQIFRPPPHHQSTSSIVVPSRACLDRIRHRLWSLLRYMAGPELVHIESGAHTLPVQQGSNSTMVGSLNNDGNNRGLQRLASALVWMTRLHLVLFYLKGGFPSFLHRWMGLQLKPSNNGAVNNATAIVNRPSFRIIGMLVSMQMIAALTKGTADLSLQTALSLNRTFHRWIRRWRQPSRREGNRNEASSINVPLSEEDELESSEQRDFAQRLERQVPSIVSSLGPHHTNDNKESNMTIRDTGTTQRTCGICMNERVHPAAPSDCGHVFCWNCIHQWVSTVRAQCPLCRCPTSPQNIIALYHYN